MTAETGSATIDARYKNSKLPKPDKKLVQLLEDLRHTLDNFNKLPKLAFRNGIYQAPDKDTIWTTEYEGISYGYRVVQNPIMDDIFTREVFIKFPAPTKQIPQQDISRALLACFEAFVDPGNEFPSITEESAYTLKMTYQFTLMYLFEKNPNLVRK